MIFIKKRNKNVMCNTRNELLSYAISRLIEQSHIIFKRRIINHQQDRNLTVFRNYYIEYYCNNFLTVCILLLF